MMVQRGRAVHLWGTAAPGESIRAALAGGKVATQADAGGQWALALPAVPADGPFVLSIHPRNKADVGRRLALQALKLVYGKDVIASGPIFGKMARAGGTIRVSFANATSALVTVDGAAPKGFMLAGADRAWHWADARIDGDSVIVSSPDVSLPVAVRYGWADDPPNTLRNQADLPAAPFRTDDWPALSSQPGP
jgi:sialate O-acetylesterase